MNCKTILDLPEFDAGMFDGSEFLMKNGGALLTIHIDKIPEIRIQFSRARWHQFTALYNCESEVIENAYFKVVEIENSTCLKAYILKDSALVKAYKELHHYQIFLDEEGCHEVFAESCNAL